MSSNARTRGLTFFAIPGLAALCLLPLGACGADPNGSAPGGVEDGLGLVGPREPAPPASILAPYGPEVCDGWDNDGDDEIDEEDPDIGLPCVTGEAGICSPGTLACVYGSLTCVRDHDPEPEDCNTPEDESCDGVPDCPGGNPVWSKQFNGSRHTAGSSLVVDSTGNIILGVDFEGPVDFGAGPVTPMSGHDALVMKRDSSGNLVWQRHFGAMNMSRVSYLDIDAMDNVYVAGNFGGTIDPGLGPITGLPAYGNFYVVKLSPSGTTLWQRGFAQYGEKSFFITLDHAGNVYISGLFEGTVDFGLGPVTAVHGTDGFVVKIDSSGNTVWSRIFSGTSEQLAIVRAVDSSNNPIASVRFQGTTDLGNGVLTASSYDAGLAKLDAATGATLWSRHYGGNGYQYVSALVDTNDDIILGGSYDTTLNLGPGPLTADGTDGIIARLDSSGNFLWQKRITGPGRQSAEVRLDSAGNWLVFGSYSGALDYGTGAIPSAGADDAYVLKLSSSGAPLWFHRYGDAGYQYISGGAVDPLGNFVFTGGFYGTIDFGSGTFASVDQWFFDVFLAKISP